MAEIIFIAETNNPDIPQVSLSSMPKEQRERERERESVCVNCYHGSNTRRTQLFLSRLLSHS